MRDSIVLPPTEFKWVTEQADNIFDNHSQIIEDLQAEITIADKYVVHNPTHHKNISRDLTRQLGNQAENIVEEVIAAIDETWGTNFESNVDVNPFESFLNIVARTSNRVFVGKSLCRNTELVKNAIASASSVVPTALVINQIPKFLRPICVPFVATWNKAYRRNFARIISPEVNSRLTELELNFDSEKASSTPCQHNDFLQWIIEAGEKSGNSQDLKPEVIIDRLGVVSFAAIHTTTITATNALFDLVSQPPSSFEDTVCILRAEVKEALASSNNTWTKQAISSLPNLDSTLRESSRLNPLASFSQGRAVVKPGGITTPISNTYLPEGSTISSPTLAIHRDPTIYPDPDSYIPFRFADLKASSKTIAANLNFSTTSPQFVHFGHGRHACPGRFFATHVLKVMLAYIVMNYDFELLEKRPENRWIGPTIVPDMRKTIRVKRRRAI